MTPQEDMRGCLMALDAPRARQLWANANAHLPQPRDDAEALAMLHAGRTGAASIPFRLRAYSHRWLSERGLPSLLPDNLRPRAERLYPVTVGAVGISVNARYPVVGAAIRGAMEHAVLDCYANGDEDPQVVHAQMMAARERERRGLYLPKGSA